MDGMAVRIPEDLNFNMAGARDVTLQKDPIVAEAALGFAPGGFERFVEFAGFAVPQWGLRRSLYSSCCGRAKTIWRLAPTCC